MRDTFPCARLPIVCGPQGNFPRWQRHEQVLGKRVNIRLVHTAQRIELLDGGIAVLKENAVSSQIAAHPAQLLGRQSVFRGTLRFGIEHM